MTVAEAIDRVKWAKFLVNHQTFAPETEEALDMAIRSLEAWEKVKAEIAETILYYKDWGRVEIKAQHKEEALKEVLDCINKHLTEVTE